MKLIKTTIIFLSLIAVFGLAKNASATTITSTSGGGTWSDNGTWSGGVAPTATDTVIIATTGGNSVNLGVGTTAANITINAGAILNANSYQLTDSGDFTFSGAFIFGTSTLQMTGSSASISNSGGSAPQFNNLIINSAGTVTVKNDPYVVGYLTITGTLSVDSGKTLRFGLEPEVGSDALTINNNSSLSGAGTIAIDNTIMSYYYSAVSLDMTNNGTINIANFSYTYLVWSWWNGHTDESVTIPGTTYGDDTTKTNVSINGTGSGAGADYTFRLTADMTVKGDLWIASDGGYNASTGILDNATSPNYNRNITVGGDFTIYNYSYYMGGTETLTVGGDWTNSGTFTAGSNTVKLNGSAPQTLSGTLTGSSAFYNLTIANTSGGSAVFNAAATVNNNYAVDTASDTVTYKSGSTYTFKNIDWNGQASGTKVLFQSSDTNPWNLRVTGSQTKVSYVSVSRSDASSGEIIYANDGTNYDGGNNTNWNFGNGGSPPTSLFRLYKNVFFRKSVSFKK